MRELNPTYEVFVTTDLLSALTSAAAGVLYLNSQCKIEHDTVQRHQNFVKSFMESAAEANLEADLVNVAFGIEEYGGSFDLPSETVNREIVLLNELKSHTVGRGNPFENLKNKLVENH